MAAYTPTTMGPGKADFHDAWRILANVAIDHQWWRADAEWQMAQSQRVVGFLSANPKGSLFTLEGKALDEGPFTGLVAMLAAGQGCRMRARPRPGSTRLWDAPMPPAATATTTGCWPLGLLQVGGRFRPWGQRFNGALRGATQPSCSSVCTPLRCVPGRAATAGWTAGVCRT